MLGWSSAGQSPLADRRETRHAPPPECRPVDDRFDSHSRRHDAVHLVTADHRERGFAAGPGNCGVCGDRLPVHPGRRNAERHRSTGGAHDRAAPAFNDQAAERQPCGWPSMFPGNGNRKRVPSTRWPDRHRRLDFEERPVPAGQRPQPPLIHIADRRTAVVDRRGPLTSDRVVEARRHPIVRMPYAGPPAGPCPNGVLFRSQPPPQCRGAVGAVESSSSGDGADRPLADLLKESGRLLWESERRPSTPCTWPCSCAPETALRISDTE